MKEESCTPTIRMALFAGSLCSGLMAMLALTEGKALGWVFVLTAGLCLVGAVWSEVEGRR